MTKIDVFSGFLGAGKTTLIKKLLKEAYSGEKLVLIENEFGEIGIDGGFMKDAGIEVTEMNQGCICCSLVGDFGKVFCRQFAAFFAEPLFEIVGDPCPFHVVIVVGNFMDAFFGLGEGCDLAVGYVSAKPVDLGLQIGRAHV